MEFQVKDANKPSSEEPSHIIKSFLSSVDPAELSNQVLDEMGWGGGDPVIAAVAKLMELADQW